MAQVEKEGPQEAPQISEEEKAHVIDKAMVGITLIEVGITKLEFLLAGCLSYSENKMLDSWYKRADEAIDRDDLDTALQYAEKIVKFLEATFPLPETAEEESTDLLPVRFHMLSMNVTWFLLVWKLGTSWSQ